jgi:predicted ATPase
VKKETMHGTSHLFVITGGPGAGKTTLIEALRAAGCVCAPEAGRQIIQDEVASGGTALPWTDPRAFSKR